MRLVRPRCSRLFKSRGDTSNEVLYLYHGPNFKEILKKATGLEVEIENDANCAALGECWLTTTRNQDCAFVVCGTGIGGALIKNRQLHVGINKHGGEFGCCIVDFDPNNKRSLKLGQQWVQLLL